VIHVDDTIQPRTKKIALAGLTPLLGMHLWCSAQITAELENHKTILQGIAISTPRSRQNQLLHNARFRFKINDLRVLHGRLIRLRPIGNDGSEATMRFKMRVATRLKDPELYTFL
jgi:hypothetical protein